VFLPLGVVVSPAVEIKIDKDVTLSINATLLFNKEE